MTGYKVCLEQIYPSGITTYEWNYYTVKDDSLIPAEWDTMSDSDKAFYLNEDENCLWVKGHVECDDDDGLDKVADSDESGLQNEIVIVLEKW